jgi:diguanylate cyclase (GGDEF)-like protein
LTAAVRRELRDREGLYLPSDHDCEELLNRARKRLREFSLETAMKLANKTRQAEQSQLQLEALKKEADRLAEQATTDALTGVGNRKFFDTRLAEEVNRSKRNHTPLSLIFFDLDRFKRLNDTHGHQAGDLVLKMTAVAIKKIMRTTDVLARYGGEELALIAPGTDPAGALATAERTRHALENLTVLYNDRVLKVTASFGVVTVVDPHNLDSEEQLVTLADECLYEAKRAGRNCIRSTIL